MSTLRALPVLMCAAFTVSAATAAAASAAAASAATFPNPLPPDPTLRVEKLPAKYPTAGSS